MNGRLKRPLNSAAIKKADAEFYARHPELKKQPQLIAMRQEWQDLYVKHGGKIEKPQAKYNKTNKNTTVSCPQTQTRCVEEKEDNDNRSYALTKDDGCELTKGWFSGFSRMNLAMTSKNSFFCIS